MKMLKAKVHGKVQGVWFRKYTLDCAKRFGIFGVVKNLDDGTVLVYAHGKNLEEFKNYLKSRPSDSDVKKIDCSWDTSKIKFSDFRIEYR